jgi:hypothetical protein|nr:MAG TPA: Protein of unknown function (DUF1642) [Caudoviricetes sp.]
MNKKELIERIEGLKKIFGNKVKYIEIDAMIELVSKLDEPETGHADEAPRYVKNILARLRELPLHDREVWLKAIMSEFEQDFCHAKWREGYEQGKFDGEWVGNQLKDADKIRQELNKPVIPQFVAEIIEYYKGQNAILYDALREKNFNKQYNEWLVNEQDAYNKVTRAWLDGYEVEKEPKYTVMVKGVPGYGRYLNKALLSKEYFFASENEVSGYRTKHTRKELEEAGFGWVFDCEGIEIEEDTD